MRVADTRQGDHDYFDRLYTAINDPVQLGAFVHMLASKNIINFNFRAKPNTGELLEQKLQSLSGFSATGMKYYVPAIPTVRSLVVDLKFGKIADLCLQAI